MGQLPVTPANLSKAIQMVKIAVTHPDYIGFMKEFTPLLFPQSVLLVDCFVLCYLKYFECTN